ncbi:MAG: metallophosphoesterase family protein [Proteobacteria bacterium]|nr:metallophosphoesterase family protein [Pseudomonadota bacterium]
MRHNWRGKHMRISMFLVSTLAGVLGCSCFIFDLARPNLKVIAGPYLQNSTQTSITIMWETNRPSTSHVDYGLDVNYGLKVVDSEEVAIHEIKLTGLSPERHYQYAVRSYLEQETVTITGGSFQTAPRVDEPFLVAVYGDSRSYPKNHEPVVTNILESIAKNPTRAIVLHTGDIVSLGSRHSRWGHQFFTPTRDLIRNTPLYPCLGNHESSSPENKSTPQPYYKFFSLPAEESASTTEAWYSFEFGCTHITVLDTCQDFHKDSAQYRWIKRDLESEKAKSAAWRFVLFHHPPFSSGRHGGDPNVQQHLVPLFESLGVDMVLSGHEHLYERSYKKGVHYIVAAGGGAPLYGTDKSENPYKVFSKSVYHHVVLKVSQSVVELEAKQIPNNTVFDRVKLAR